MHAPMEGPVDLGEVMAFLRPHLPAMPLSRWRSPAATIRVNAARTADSLIATWRPRGDQLTTARGGWVRAEEQAEDR